jgi:hypothetical protein
MRKWTAVILLLTITTSAFCGEKASPAQTEAGYITQYSQAIPLSDNLNEKTPVFISVENASSDQSIDLKSALEQKLTELKHPITTHPGDAGLWFRIRLISIKPLSSKQIDVLSHSGYGNSPSKTPRKKTKLRVVAIADVQIDEHTVPDQKSENESTDPVDFDGNDVARYYTRITVITPHSNQTIEQLNPQLTSELCKGIFHALEEKDDN